MSACVTPMFDPGQRRSPNLVGKRTHFSLDALCTLVLAAPGQVHLNAALSRNLDSRCRLRLTQSVQTSVPTLCILALCTSFGVNLRCPSSPQKWQLYVLTFFGEKPNP